MEGSQKRYLEAVNRRADKCIRKMTNTDLQTSTQKPNDQSTKKLGIFNYIHFCRQYVVT